MFIMFLFISNTDKMDDVLDSIRPFSGNRNFYGYLYFMVSSFIGLRVKLVHSQSVAVLQ